jgi:hypothetical protein
MTFDFFVTGERLKLEIERIPMGRRKTEEIAESVSRGYRTGAVTQVGGDMGRQRNHWIYYKGSSSSVSGGECL